MPEPPTSAAKRPQPKQQHYVHRVYLEGFVDPDLEKRGESYIWAYLPGKPPFRQRPDRIAKRNYYYCFDRENRRQFDVEHTLQKLEDVSLPIVRRLRNRQFRLGPEDRLTLAGYTALSYTRVPRFEGLVNRVAMLDTAFRMQEFTSDPENLKLLAREESERTGKSVTPEQLLNTLNAGSVYLTQTRVVTGADDPNHDVTPARHIRHVLVVPCRRTRRPGLSNYRQSSCTV